MPAKVRHSCIQPSLVTPSALMKTLHDIITTSPDLALAGGGLLIGALFGVLAQATNYCLMGAIADWWLTGNRSRLGAAALAAATAIFGAQALDAAGITDLTRSIYLLPRLNWLAAIVGGLVFGYGMVYAGGCPSRALVRAGGGDLRGFVVLLALALAALAALSGIFGGLRVTLERTTAIDLAALGLPTQSLADVLAILGLSGGIGKAIATLLLGGPLLFFAFGPARIITSPRNLAGGFGIGLLVTLGWALTGLAYDEMASSPAVPTSLSFIKPVSDAIDWLERATALGLPGFGVMSVFGVLAGSFMAAMAGGSFRHQGFSDRADLTRHVLGALAMGLGGILALGCTIGQGVTGLSTLALHAIPAVAAIITGAVLALHQLAKKI